MTSLKLRYVHRFRDRHGAVRHYFRRPGFPRAALPGLPGSAEFMAAYQSCLAGTPAPIGAARTVPGSMTSLAVSWYQSAGFKAVGATTQANYRRVVERFLADHGTKPVRDIEPRHIRAMIDAKAATPGAANFLLVVLKLLLRHAAEYGFRSDDPAAVVRKIPYRKSSHATWMEPDIAAFEARWPLGTRAHLAMSLMLYLGQRRGDVVRLGRQHLSGNVITLTQGKTGTRLAIPVHPRLREAIDACPSDALMFLVTESGKPFASAGSFANWFDACCEKAGLAPGLSAHGLRRAAARRLAEAGCTPHQIAAVTGHKSLSQVQGYSSEADQERMAGVAMGRIGNIGGKPEMEG